MKKHLQHRTFKQGLCILSDANTATPEDIYKAVQTIIKLNKVQFEQEFRKKNYSSIRKKLLKNKNRLVS